jgi:hypothetical protein
MKQAYKALLLEIRRYEREGVELWHWSKREMFFQSEAYKKLVTTKNKFFKCFIFKCIDRIDKIENEFESFRQKALKERGQIITAIRIMKQFIENPKYENIKFDNYSNIELKNILDEITEIRNKKLQ